MGWVRSRLSYANVVATLALMCSLGGTSYAALTITGKNVKDGSLLSADFKAGQLPAGAQGPQGAQGLPGAQGPAGQQGEKGEKGDKGASGATNVTFRTGTTVTINTGTAGFATAECLPGERATGGGAFATRNDAYLSASIPSGNPPTGWTAALRSPVANAQFTAYVVCAAP